ncbi:MAG TPA: hypothetical protein VMJ93_02740 [Verrucomicrobiae bacterium]|nr:hypothetical protein [Verrucomicrobiae bacterium]
MSALAAKMAQRTTSASRFAENEIKSLGGSGQILARPIVALFRAHL